MDVLGARLYTPGSKRVGGQAGSEPIGEGLRRCEVVIVEACLGVGMRERHGGYLQKAAMRVELKREKREFEGFGGGREENEKRESCEPKIRKRRGFV